MPKKLLATTITIALVLTMLSAIPTSKANFVPVSYISLTSPIFYPIPATLSDSAISNFKSNGVPFSVEIWVSMKTNSYQEINHIYYCVDGQPAKELTNVTKSESMLFGRSMQYSSSGVFNYLEDGNHTFMVYTEGTKEQLSKAVDFTVPMAIISNPPTPTITTNLTQQNDSVLAMNFSLVVISIIVVSGVFGVFLLVYFRRRKGKP
jgi:hypothetical protein